MPDVTGLGDLEAPVADGEASESRGGTSAHPLTLPPSAAWASAWTWIKCPKDTDRSASRLATIFGLLAFAGIMAFLILELRPGLIFGPGIDVGGDNGGHVAAPYFLIHYLLPAGRLTGWDPWWFDGFPLYVFYFPLPALLVAIASGVFPYAVAFKVVTVLGTLTLPACAYAFGRLAGFRRPAPVLMAASSLPFLFNTSYTIDGGNIVSTMAGEFSFSLAVSTGLLFLGVVAYGLRTGRLRWLAALLFAVTCVCHVVPALAFGAAAVIFSLANLRRSTWWTTVRVLVPIGVVGALLAAWWLLPFGADLQYSSSMNYQPVGGPWPHWFTLNFLPGGYLFVLIAAVLGLILSLVVRNRFALSLGLCSALTVFAFHFLPSGLVYNARWLPFWFLFTALLGGYGFAELFRLAGRYVAPSGFAAAAVTLGTLGAISGSVVLGGLEGNGFFGYTTPATHLQVGGWVEWNNSGLQAKSGWKVWQDMVSMLDRAGRKYGCGRLQYEYISETTDPFGSTEALMSLPMFTHGCMETTDGIYFESSTTTPFHFLDVSEVSQNGESPDPVVGLNYPGYNLPDGIRHLQLMGVRYFLAMSPPVEAAASADPSLVRIASTPSFPGPYNGLPVPDPHMVLYLIKNASLVVPLTHVPEVENVTASEWLSTNLKWYEEEQYWPTLLARKGPAAWPRASPGELVPASAAVRAPSTTVSHVVSGTESLTFDVTRTGTPVLVKIPYFPNWEASGARGPFEVSPNVMVVVPTRHHVTLVYGTTTVDWAGKIASLGGLFALVGLAVGRPPVPPLPATPAPPERAPFIEGDEEDGESPNESGPEVSVVFPAHNEEDFLDETVSRVVAALDGARRSFEVVVVENGSRDETATRARALAAAHPQLSVIRLSAPDYGAALRAGFFAARGEMIVSFDVDYYDVEFLATAAAHIDAGADIVLASKRADGSRDGRPLARRLLTAGFTFLMRHLLVVSVGDAHGIKALRRSTIRPLVAECTMTGSLFDVELVARAERSGRRVIEVPTEVSEVRPARTSVGGRVFEALFGLARLRWRLGPPQQP